MCGFAPIFLMIIRNRTTKTLEASPLNNRNHPNAAGFSPSFYRCTFAAKKRKCST
jgi:hypothetical protein